jgi:hypothetical protein
MKISMMKWICLGWLLALGLGDTVNAQEAAKRDKETYVKAVTRGAGLMPWQEEGVSEKEKAFRAMIEARKTAILEKAEVTHPAMISPEMLARAKANIAEHKWAQGWVANQLSTADYIVAQPKGWIEQMIPRETAAHAYGFTCPKCVGDKSQEAVGHSLARWSYKNPESIVCGACGQTYPDAAYPETQELNLPRRGEMITYYQNDAQRANPEDRSGKLAWHWVGYPMNVSFSGIIRERKIGFMRSAVKSLAFAYLFTEDPKYAVAARDVLVRYAECYRDWAYHDYWDGFADCDPLYAAWHDTSLPIEWKRHLSENAYKKDSLDKARMMQNYWGAGRVHPSTDGVSGLSHFAMAYDLTADAVDAQGKRIWDEASDTKVKRDLLLECIMGAEPYVGGAGEANNENNKAPRIYNAMGAIGKTLGIPEYIDTALRGYETVRDASFLYDGFSTESPSYTNMYLSQLLIVPEMLHGYEWPAHFTKRSGKVDLYSSDTQLCMMYRSVLDTLFPSAHYLTLSDTRSSSKPSLHIVQMGLKRYPEYYSGVLPSIHSSATSEYALFNLSTEEITQDTGLKTEELYYPAWQTGLLRNGSGSNSSVLALTLNPQGGHRHYDNLSVLYTDGSDNILGDHGYVGDMPVNKWIKSTLSHNLVVVDGKGQEFSGRKPELDIMATSPMASVIEAHSTAYAQCDDYRRRMVLVKIDEHDSFAIDFFKVSGGEEHRYRVYSDLASSDAKEGRIEFSGISLPEEPPLPQVGSSLDMKDIYGLRDVRGVDTDADSWQAQWIEEERSYRLWMASSSERVEASNGPGQRDLKESGRRVRYVDVIRSGNNVQSHFAAVHEPSVEGAVIDSVKRIALPSAGPDAIGLEIQRGLDTYYVLNNVERRTSIAPVTFEGTFAIVRIVTNGSAEYFTVGADYLAIHGKPVHKNQGVWKGKLTRLCETQAKVDTPQPGDWAMPDGAVNSYARIRTDQGWTGFPVVAVEDDVLSINRFPLPEDVHEMEFHAVRYGKK